MHSPTPGIPAECKCAVTHAEKYDMPLCRASRGRICCCPAEPRSGRRAVGGQDGEAKVVSAGDESRFLRVSPRHSVIAGPRRRIHPF